MWLQIMLNCNKKLRKGLLIRAPLKIFMLKKAFELIYSYPNIFPNIYQFPIEKHKF